MPVEEFWQWWADGGRERLERTFRGEIPHDQALFDEVEQRIHAIAPTLAFEFYSGTHTEFALTVTAEGISAFRGAARRWLNAAPASDAWEFSDVRGRKDDFNITFGGVTAHCDDLRFNIQPGQAVLNLGVYHPAFAELENAPHLGFLLLDGAIGERAVELRIGRIDWLQEPGPASTVDELREAVAALEEHFPVDGEPRWAVFESTENDQHYVARVRPPLKPLSDPLKEIHLRIDVAGVEMNELYDLEDALLEVQGSRLVAVETLDGTRTFHLYTTQEAIPALKELAKDHHGEGTVDPGWVKVSHLHF